MISRTLRVALAGLGLGLAACHGHGHKTHREGSAAPVEVVARPQLPDAGAAAGSTGDEIEPNDADGVATLLPLGGTVRAKIDPEADVDRFRIDVAEAGELQIMLAGVDGTDLVLELEDEGGQTIAKSDRGGARVKEGIPNAGVTPGRYFAVVHAIPKKQPRWHRRHRRHRHEPPPAPAPVYEITAKLVQPAAGAEREPDDDRGTANDLIVGDTATGYVGWNGDADVWKLSIETLAASNAIDVEVSRVEGVALTLEVADGIGRPLVQRKAPRGAELLVRGLLPVVPAGGSPFYYLTVGGERSNPETPYQLRVTAHLVGVDAEVEPDDTPETAFAIPPDRTIVHASWTPGDVDCFAVPVAAEPRTLDVTVAPKGALALGIELLVDGSPIAASAHGRHPAAGAAATVSGTIPGNAHAVIRVTGLDAAAKAEGGYDVSVKEAAAPTDAGP